MTECSERRLESEAPDGRTFTAAFDGGAITSDGGIPLLRLVDERCNILERFGQCFEDFRNPDRVQFTTTQLATQRVLSIALGYEDLNDLDFLRSDPLLATAVGLDQKNGQKLASSVTLGRIENSSPGLSRIDRYRRVHLDHDKVDQLLIDLFLEAHEEPPEEVILDLDATDAMIHGKQEGRFYHGYYDEYCYLPLYIFAGDHILGARLRRADEDGAAQSTDELDRIYKGLRAAWPDVRLVIRADSGFCRDWLLSWCEKRHGVDYVIGIARNPRLQALLEPTLEVVRKSHEVSAKPEREFHTFAYRTKDSWSRPRRIVGKAEHLPKGANPRFLVTSFTRRQWESRELYEDLYCERGEMENRIKEQQLDLFADRVSCQWERGNQLRMYYSAMAYALLEAFRRMALTGTKMARAQCGTIRLRFLRIGARIRCTARRVWIHLSEHCPWRDEFVQAWQRLTPT